MRCKNCGWVNPDELDSCEKCHSALKSEDNIKRPEVVLGTVIDSVSDEEDTPERAAASVCSRCGYPLGSNTKNCPNCGNDLEAEIKRAEPKGEPVVKPSSFSGTVFAGPVSGNESNKSFFTLRPVAWSGEKAEYNPVTYSGENIVLNRANTDANNNTITSKQQAIISKEDGEWYIENRSELKSTFLRVDGKVKLSDGDVIILGNREFVFRG